MCFNRFLAEHLRRGLADIDGGRRLLVRRALSGGGHARRESTSPCRRDAGRVLGPPTPAFAEHIEVAIGRYGALVVDEAQDFHEDWWISLQLLLEDPDPSPLYVFYDDNQRIFPVPKNFPVPDEPYQLTRNCRNTQAINKIVRRLLQGRDDRSARAPEASIDPHFYATEARCSRSSTTTSALGRGGRGSPATSRS